MRMRAGIVAAAVALALVAAACGGGGAGGGGAGGGGGGDEGGTISLDGKTANDHGSADVSGQAEFKLELDDFYFEPTVLQGSPGQQLKIELENEGNAKHNFSLEDQGIDQDVESGASAEVTVTFPNSGTLLFVCEYHEAQGMVGALEAS